MLQFKKLTKEHIPLLRKYLRTNKYYCCENTFGFIYLWKDTENIYVSEEDGVMYIMSIIYGSSNFYYPFGENITADCFRKIDEYCTHHGAHLKFWYLTQENVQPLKDYFQDRISLVNERDWADYLYNYNDLYLLPGKRYHNQKNYINRFARNYQYEFVSYDDSKKALLEGFFDTYYEEQNKESTLFKEEKKVLQYLADNYNDLDMLGSLLIVDNEAIGISFGEIVEDTIYVHFEKALKRFEGSYATVNNLFLQMYHSPEIKFINREEDVGDMGLRTAKMRLRPVRLVDKYFGDVTSKA